jgi:molybdopterin converting factor small subunit
MIGVTVELWMWLGKEIGGDFKSPSEMRSILEIGVENGITIKRFFDNLADRYPLIGEKIFKRENKTFFSNVVVVLNDRVISPYTKVYEKVLEDGDKITILPIYTGG